MRRILTLFWLIFGLALALADTGNNDSVFVPTKAWQTVAKGTPIPPGLHIRHNLQTGVTEAKLLDENEEKDKVAEEETLDDSQQNSLTLHPEKALKDEESDLLRTNEPSEEPKIPFDELKAMLKKIKSDDAETILQSQQVDQVQQEKRKFRSYAELKEDLEALNMNVSTDSEILTNLFTQFEPHKEFIAAENLDSMKVEEILEILNNIEYLIHQMDNALMFADMGGMSKIISPSLNSTNTEVKAEALKLLGAAVQSNPRVQLKALENDFVQKLLRILTVNNKVEVKSRCLFALGALVRHFPAAQKALVNNGGLEIFGKVLTDGHFLIQTRVMNLINDLTIERDSIKMIEDEQQKMRRMHEYDLTDFESKLIKQKYCQNLIELAIRSLRINSEIDDFHEVIYESMITLNTICKNYFSTRKQELLPEIQKKLVLYRDFPKLSEDGENLNSYHQELLEKLQNIILESQHHDEL